MGSPKEAMDSLFQKLRLRKWFVSITFMGHRQNEFVVSVFTKGGGKYSVSRVVPKRWKGFRIVLRFRKTRDFYFDVEVGSFMVT